MAWPNGRDTTPKPKLPTAEDRAEEIHRDLFHTENAAYGFVFAQMKGGFNTAPDRVLRWCLVYAVCQEGRECLARNAPAEHEIKAFAKWKNARETTWIPTGDGMEATTVNGASLTIHLRDGKVFVNDAEVVIADVLTDNGVVHAINTVLIPA